jgi:hypothetical protein
MLYIASYNDVFADIVNGLLFNGEQIIWPDELVEQIPRAAYKASVRLHTVKAF